MTGESVPFVIWNRGKNLLTGVEVSIHNMREYHAARTSGEDHRIYVGTIPTEWPKSLPAIVPEIEDDGMAHYMAEIWAQNGYYTENINFRRATKGPSSWAFQYWETKQERINGPTKEFPQAKGIITAGRMVKDCQQPKWSDGSNN
jgi:hypothetical protein